MKARRYADAALHTLALVMAAAALLIAVHYFVSTQAAERRSGQLLERKLCQTFGKLAANRPPAGNPLTNPSRAYDQRNHADLVQLGGDLGCKETP